MGGENRETAFGYAVRGARLHGRGSGRSPLDVFTVYSRCASGKVGRSSGPATEPKLIRQAHQLSVGGPPGPPPPWPVRGRPRRLPLHRYVTRILAVAIVLLNGIAVFLQPEILRDVQHSPARRALNHERKLARSR